MNADVLRKLICPNCGSPRLSKKTLSVIDDLHKGIEQSSLNAARAVASILCVTASLIYPVRFRHSQKAFIAVGHGISAACSPI